MGGKMKPIKTILIMLFLAGIVLTACESLKTARPMLPMKEYEKMLVGSLEAEYVGTDTCLATCHYHDDQKKNLDASTMGVQISKKTHMPIVNCEACHGPGSLAIEGLTREQVEEDARNGKQTKCRYEMLIEITKLPAPAKSLICLKCHAKYEDFNLHTWNSGVHAINDVSCSDCHKIHMGPDLIIRKEEMENLCEKCHFKAKAEFSLPSHHPVHEKKIFCISCHEPHGSEIEKNLKKTTVKEVCVQCHADKEGPYTFEHSENMEDCTTCHSPHGSINNNLLKARQPFLCLQCHSGHRTSATSTTKAEFYTRCTDCHSRIHGTDIPGASGTGRFTQ